MASKEHKKTPQNKKNVQMKVTEPPKDNEPHNEEGKPENTNCEVKASLRDNYDPSYKDDVDVPKRISYMNDIFQPIKPSKWVTEKDFMKTWETKKLKGNHGTGKLF